MNLERTIFPLMVAFNEDFKKNKGPSHITDLILITIKSLIPSEEYVRVDIDYTRYKEELKLWKYYKNGDNPSLLNVLGKLDSVIYWKGKDDTLYYRLIPIILANKNFDFIREEVVKNILFTTGNIELLIEGLLISKLIAYLLNNKSDIIDDLKDEVIHLAQTEFLQKYKPFFRAPFEEYPGNFSVEFEQNRIFALNTLNSVFSPKYKALERAIRALDAKRDSDRILDVIVAYYKDSKEDYNIQLDRYYFQLGQYIYNLRNGRIDPKLLKIDKYHLPDIFQFKEGDVFYHSLLNRSQVIKREDLHNKTIIHLKTKSGIYTLVKD